MIERLFRVIAVLVALCSAIPAFAAERGTADEAKALVQKAVALYRGAGPAAALAAFNETGGAFQPKDLFVVAIGLDGVMRQHAKVAAFNGKDVSQLRDAEGKLFVQEQLKIATGPGAGWVEFVFSNPAEKTIENKIMYLEKVHDVFLGVGYFVSRR